MSGREIALVGCRLIAIYWALHTVYAAVNLIQAIPILRSGFFGEAAQQPDMLVYYGVISIILYLGSAVGLWLGAKPLARAVLPDVRNRTKIIKLNLSEAQAIAFSAVGLLILVGALPKLAAEIYRLHLINDAFDAPPTKSLHDKIYPIQIGLELLLGFILLFGGRTFSCMLWWFRGLGMKSKASNDRYKGGARKRRVP